MQSFLSKVLNDLPLERIKPASRTEVFPEPVFPFIRSFCGRLIEKSEKDLKFDMKTEFIFINVRF